MRLVANREEQNEKRRQDILSSGLRLFVEKGYAGTTVRDISATTGASNGLLFHYFKTKEEIIAELAKHAMAGVASVASLLSSGLPPLDIFRKITETVLMAYRTAHGRSLFLLVNQIKTQSSIPAKVKKIVNAIDAIGLSVPIIRKGQKAGAMKDGNPLALAIVYWSAVQGIGETLGWYPDAPLPEPGQVLDILKK
jgi:TetR/AcrR family transcriptional regulator